MAISYRLIALYGFIFRKNQTRKTKRIAAKTEQWKERNKRNIKNYVSSLS